MQSCQTLLRYAVVLFYAWQSYRPQTSWYTGQKHQNCCFGTSIVGFWIAKFAKTKLCELLILGITKGNYWKLKYEYLIKWD